MENKFDLTSGSIPGKIILVALPVMGTQVMQMLYNITDMFWLGRLSAGAVAASGAAGMYLWLSAALMVFCRMGAEIGVSQNIGRGDTETARSYAQISVTLALLTGALYCSVMLLFTGRLVSFLNIQEPQVALAAREYLWIASIGIPATFISGVITGIFNGSGNTRIPFYINAAGLTISALLNPVMIFTLGYGIRGAAISTAFAQWLVTFVLLLALKKHKDRPFASFPVTLKLEPVKMAQITRWSLPISLETAFFASLSMLITRLTASFGSDFLAISRIGGQIESISWLISGGFGSALTTYIGQNFGAGKWSRISDGYRVSSVAMFLWGAFSSLILVFGGYRFFSLFLADERLRALGSEYLRCLAICQIAACLSAVGAGYFRGCGRTVPPSAVSIVSNSVRIPLCYALASTALGIRGVWYGIVASAFARDGVIFAWSLRALLREKSRRKAIS